MTTTRKRTVFIPCPTHEATYAAYPRRRRAEVMAEGGWAHQDKCPCRMKPGTDYFSAGFVAEHETYFVNR